MSFPPILIFHISAGALTLLSGGLALVLRKGSPRHRLAGRVFVIAVVSMTTSAVYLALVAHEIGNCLVAALTLYLVVTSWRTARRSDGAAGVFELGALLVALALGAGLIVFAVQAAHSPDRMKDGHSALRYSVYGLVACLAGAGDLRLLILGVNGPQRLARHLWRMTFPLLVSANTFFQGQARLFPPGVRRVHVLYLPIVLIIGATTFWFIRLWFFPRDPLRPVALDWLRIFPRRVSDGAEEIGPAARSGVVSAGGTDFGTTPAVASPGARGPAAGAPGSDATAVGARSPVDRATPGRSR